VKSSRAALLAAVTLLVLVAARRDTWPLLRGPAPYPPEWQWGYAPKPAPPGRLLPVVGLAGALVALAALAGRAASRRGARAGLLAGCTVVGCGFQLALLGLEPAGAAAELERRTTSGSFTSYFKVAAGVEDGADFLAHHLLGNHANTDLLLEIFIRDALFLGLFFQIVNAGHHGKAFA